MKVLLPKSRIILFTLLAFTALQCTHDPVIDQGPGDSNPPGGQEPCDPDSVYFDPDIRAILSTNCAFSGCHDAATASDGIVLESYESMLNSDDKLVSSDIEENELWEVINETDPDKLMPPPPASPVSSDQKQMIQDWINQGAQNNKCASCDPTQFTYSEGVRPLLETNCSGSYCHSQGGVFSLMSYDDVVGAVTYRNLIQAINHDSQLPSNKWMPPSGMMDAECIQLIQNWVDNGMQND